MRGVVRMGWVASAGVLALGLVIASGCAGRIQPALAPSEPQPDHWLKMPKTVDVEFVVTVTVDQVLWGEALAEENRRLGIAETTSPTLMLWSADLKNHFGQIVNLKEVSPPPRDVRVDAENGNRLLFWDLSNQLVSSETLTIRRVYSVTLNEYVPSGFMRGAKSTLPDDIEAAFYTKSEAFNEITEEIKKASGEAVGDATAPLKKARRIFRWVRTHMTYEYPPPGGRGATVALREGKGDCGQYADLFVAMCRAQGIPARFAGGFRLGPAPAAGEAGTVGSHAWAEFRLPNGQWLPADPTGDEKGHFARLRSNSHLTASVGRNIALPHAPDWARYSFSDVEEERTEFMQSLTQVKTGVKATVKVERRWLPSTEASPGSAAVAR